MIGRVENDLAAIVGHGRPSIGEPTDVVVIGCLESTGAERTAVPIDVGGQVGAVLAVTDHVNDGAESGIDTDVG